MSCVWNSSEFAFLARPRWPPLINSSRWGNLAKPIAEHYSLKILKELPTMPKLNAIELGWNPNKPAEPCTQLCIECGSKESKTCRLCCICMSDPEKRDMDFNRVVPKGVYDTMFHLCSDACEAIHLMTHHHAGEEKSHRAKDWRYEGFK